MDYRLVIYKKDGSVSKHYYEDYDTMEYNSVFCQFSPNIVKALGQKFSIFKLGYKTLFTIGKEE